TVYSAGNYNVALAVGDFNGDDREDVVVVTGSWGGEQADPVNDNKLLLYLQQADGPLAAPTRLAITPPRYSGRLGAGDLGRDGKSDLVWATEAGLNVFFGSSNGLRAGPLLTGVTNAEVPGHFVFGDMNLDGYLDIVAWMAGRSIGGTSPNDMKGLTIFYGDGHGGISARRFLQQTIDGGEMAWVDVNRDGRSDLVSFWGSGNQDSGVAIY